MMGSTLVSMVLNLRRFAMGDSPDLLLTAVGGALLLLGIWLLVEAALALRSERQTDDPLIDLGPSQGGAA